MKKWKRYFKYRFNLIEIVLAMGVVGIGIAGVMSMMAPALSANRDALQESIAAEAAGKIMALIEMQSRRYSGTLSGWTTAMRKLGAESTVASGVMTKIEHKESDVPNDDDDGIKDIDEILLDLDKADAIAKTDFFKVVKKAKKADGEDDTDEEPEIIAHARIYVVQSQDVKTGSGGALSDLVHPALDTSLIRFVIEVSWPTDVDYTRRQFRYFTYEAIGPGE